MMKQLSLFLMLAFISVNAYSQGSNSELLKKLVEKNILTQAEADDLMKTDTVSVGNNKIEHTITKVRDIFPNIPYIRIGGYGLMMYQYKQYNDVHHNFIARAVFLSINGKITDNLSYNVLTELVDPMLYEYYATWTPLKEINIRGGQFKVPFTFENQIALFNIETILNTRSVSALAGMGDDPQKLNNGKNKTGRDLGIQLSGSFINMGNHDLLQYAAGLFQGEGMNVWEKDNTKDFAGTLTLQPIKNLRIAGGLYAGRATYLGNGDSQAKGHTRNRWALSADYNSELFYFRSEWIKGRDGHSDKEGLYGMGLWYFLPQKMNVAGKIDYYNQDKKTNSEVIDYTLALNYYFYKQCRFQLNYTFSDYSKNWVGVHKTENAVNAQMQIVF